MREEALSRITDKRRTLALLAALLAGMAALFGLGTRPAETQTPPAQTTYDVQDLGALGGNYSFAYGMNDSGQVVGNSYTSSGYRHAFLYEDGQMKDLGTLGGNHSFAYGMNDSGQVVGFSYTGSFSDPHHAFLYEAGQMKDLGTLGGRSSYAYGINDSGQIVGDAQTGSADTRAFLYEDGQMKDLGTLGGTYSAARGIIDSGQIVGDSGIRGGGWGHAFLYEGGQMKDLGALDGSSNYSFAYGTNDSGQVVGSSYTGSNFDTQHAFLYEDGQMKDLGTLGGNHSFAYGINDSGQAVGSSYTSSADTRAFLYEDGQMKDLNTLIPQDTGWTLLDAHAISTDGKIAASGSKSGVGTRALLLTPSAASDSTPPELTLPGEGDPKTITEEAMSPSGAAVTFAATATDEEPANPTVECASAEGLKSGDTFPMGKTEVKCSARDAAGNEATGSFYVHVVYDFGNGSGGSYSRPLEGDKLNEVKAGAGVPVKFGLGGDYGLDIFATNYPTSKKIDCGTQQTVDPLEETVSISNSGLKYDAASSQYVYNWKTDKAWSGTCRQLVMKFADGTTHPVNFKFK